MNHHDRLAVYEEEFREKRERAVSVVRDAPEKFDELHARALREAAEASRDGPAVPFCESVVAPPASEIGVGPIQVSPYRRTT